MLLEDEIRKQTYQIFQDLVSGKIPTDEMGNIAPILTFNLVMIYGSGILPPLLELVEKLKTEAQKSNTPESAIKLIELAAEIMRDIAKITPSPIPPKWLLATTKPAKPQNPYKPPALS